MNEDIYYFSDLPPYYYELCFLCRRHGISCFSRVWWLSPVKKGR